MLSQGSWGPPVFCRIRIQWKRSLIRSKQGFVLIMISLIRNPTSVNSDSINTISKDRAMLRSWISEYTWILLTRVLYGSVSWETAGLKSMYQSTNPLAIIILNEHGLRYALACLSCWQRSLTTMPHFVTSYWRRSWETSRRPRTWWCRNPTSAKNYWLRMRRRRPISRF